jgi:hypothetical protein
VREVDRAEALTDSVGGFTFGVGSTDFGLAAVDRTGRTSAPALTRGVACTASLTPEKKFLNRIIINHQFYQKCRLAYQVVQLC